MSGTGIQSLDYIENIQEVQVSTHHYYEYNYKSGYIFPREIKGL